MGTTHAFKPKVTWDAAHIGGCYFLLAGVLDNGMHLIVEVELDPEEKGRVGKDGRLAEPSFPPTLSIMSVHLVRFACVGSDFEEWIEMKNKKILSKVDKFELLDVVENFLKFGGKGHRFFRRSPKRCFNGY